MKQEQLFNLIAPVTNMKILDSLNNIGDGKALGTNGYIVLRNFFFTRKMAKPVYYTIITLVSKTPNLITIKEFSLIFCCSILYKIIAKIQANKLRKVVPSIIYEAQEVLYQEKE